MQGRTGIPGEAAAASSVGDRIRALRIGWGLSQRDLSTDGVSYAYISRLEAGARTPSVKALRKLAASFNEHAEERGFDPVTVEWLEFGDDLAPTYPQIQRVVAALVDVCDTLGLSLIDPKVILQSEPVFSDGVAARLGVETRPEKGLPELSTVDIEALQPLAGLRA